MWWSVPLSPAQAGSTLTGLAALSQRCFPKPTHSMNRLTCSAGSWKSPSNSSRAHCREGAGVEHWDLPSLCPLGPLAQAQGEGKAVLGPGPAAELGLPAGSSWGHILPVVDCMDTAGGGNGKGRQRCRGFLAACQCSTAYLQRVLDGAGEVPQGAEGEGAIPGGASWLQRLGQGGHHDQHIPPWPLCARVQQWCAAAEAAALQIGTCREPGVLGSWGHILGLGPIPLPRTHGPPACPEHWQLHPDAGRSHPRRAARWQVPPGSGELSP